MMDHETKTKHESYGTIGVNRVSGSTYLFGSDALHHGFIRIEINDATMIRGLCNDRVYADRRLVSVDMTFEQWATLISSFGIGMGTPCTLRQVGDKQYEDPPEPEHFSSKFQKDLKSTVAKAMTTLEDLTAKLEEVTLPGNKPLGKKELTEVLKDIQHAIMQIKQNIPYIEDQFDEMMEKKVAAAVIEVESVIAAGLREAGMESLKNGLPEYNRAFSMPKLAAGEVILGEKDE